MLLAVSLYLLLLLPLPDSLRVFNGMLGVSESRVLNCYTLFRLISLTLFVSRNLTLISLSLSRFTRFSALRSDWSHYRSGIFSTDVTDASGASVSFYELSISSLSLLEPYSDYVEISIPLNDFSSLSFLNVYAPAIRSSPKKSKTIFFSIHSSLIHKSLYSERLQLSLLPLRFKKCFRSSWEESVLLGYLL